MVFMLWDRDERWKASDKQNGGINFIRKEHRNPFSWILKDIYRTRIAVTEHQKKFLSINLLVLAITGLNQLRSKGRNQILVTLFGSKSLTLLKERYLALPLLNGNRQMGPYNVFIFFFVSFSSLLLVVPIFGCQ